MERFSTGIVMPEGGRSIRFPDWSKNNLLGSNQPRRYSHPALENTKMKSSPNLIASVSPILEAIRTLPTLYFERASTSRSCSSGERKRGPARRWTCANLVWRAIFCFLSCSVSWSIRATNVSVVFLILFSSFAILAPTYSSPATPNAINMAPNSPPKSRFCARIRK